MKPPFYTVTACGAKLAKQIRPHVETKRAAGGAHARSKVGQPGRHPDARHLSRREGAGNPPGGQRVPETVVPLGLGAMIGRFLEYSGGGRALADWLLEKFGIEHAAWAMLAAAFLVGLPIFFEVGFIILVPLVWNLTRETKRSLLFYGLPMAAALTMTHSLVPPHPAPAAATQLLGGDLGSTILYGAALPLPRASSVAALRVARRSAAAGGHFALHHRRRRRA